MREETLKIASSKGFIKKEIQTKTFLLTSFQRLNVSHKRPVTIYIEGDGRSWINKNTISPDPTPLNPLALKLAQLDSNSNVVYLARPCQYTSHVKDEFCNPHVWTDERFSPKVIAAMNEAVDQIKAFANADKVHLVGYSGGGGLAVLMAAHRKDQDVLSIQTIAGDLDIVAMSEYHHASPSPSSLNPKDYAYAVKHIPQTHYVGGKDTVVPVFIAQGFLKALQQSQCDNQVHHSSKDLSYAKIKIIEENDHHHGWENILTRYIVVH